MRLRYRLAARVISTPGGRVAVSFTGDVAVSIRPTAQILAIHRAGQCCGFNGCLALLNPHQVWANKEAGHAADRR